MHANEMTEVRVKARQVSKHFKVLGYASNILRNKSDLVIGICTTFTCKLFACENVAFYTKQDFLFYIDTTLAVEVFFRIERASISKQKQ